MTPPGVVRLDWSDGWRPPREKRSLTGNTRIGFADKSEIGPIGDTVAKLAADQGHIWPDHRRPPPSTLRQCAAGELFRAAIDQERGTTGWV